jgi:hypothetical protein
VKPNVGRILVYLLVLFGGILVPWVGGFLLQNADPKWLETLLTDYLAFAVASLVVYGVLWSYFLCRGGAWAAQTAPSFEVPPVAAEELRRRLLAVNDLNVPFHVREEAHGRLVAEWRIVDVKWAGILQAGGLNKAHQIYLELDPAAHKVRCQDRSLAISWNAGVAELGGSFSFFRGISLFEYDSGALAGLFFKDGQWTVGQAYHYRFALAEMKIPLIEAIIRSGWTFAPVITYWRWLGG